MNKFVTFTEGSISRKLLQHRRGISSLSTSTFGNDWKTNIHTQLGSEVFEFFKFILPLSEGNSTTTFKALVQHGEGLINPLTDVLASWEINSIMGEKYETT
jgi:hypothetical protein